MRRFPGITRTILRSLVGKPATLMYPQQPRRYPEATRGRVENEIARCIFCGMCQKNCPTDAIAVSKEKRDWQIDSLRCCQCRRCVEVCPVKCLSMHDAYFPSVSTRAAGLYLVVGPPKETLPSPGNASPQAPSADAVSPGKPSGETNSPPPALGQVPGEEVGCAKEEKPKE